MALPFRSVRPCTSFSTLRYCYPHSEDEFSKCLNNCLEFLHKPLGFAFDPWSLISLIGPLKAHVNLKLAFGRATGEWMLLKYFGSESACEITLWENQETFSSCKGLPRMRYWPYILSSVTFLKTPVHYPAWFILEGEVAVRGFCDDVQFAFVCCFL